MANVSQQLFTKAMCGLFELAFGSSFTAPTVYFFLLIRYKRSPLGTIKIRVNCLFSVLLSHINSDCMLNPATHQTHEGFAMMTFMCVTKKKKKPDLLRWPQQQVLGLRTDGCFGKVFQDVGQLRGDGDLLRAVNCVGKRHGCNLQTNKQNTTNKEPRLSYADDGLGKTGKY